MTTRVRVHMFLLGTVLTLAGGTSSAQVPAANTYRNDNLGITLRYPEDWSQATPRVASTVLLLKPPTAGLSVFLTSFDAHEARGRSEESLYRLRRFRNNRDVFEQMFSGSVQAAEILRYWRGYISQKDAGFAEVESTVYVSDQPQSMRSAHYRGRRAFYDAVCRAREHAVLDAVGGRARRRAEREAIWRVLESFGLVRRTRGGAPFPAREA